MKADHALADRARISVKDLDGEPLVYFHPKTPHLSLIEPMFKAAGVEPCVAIENRFAEASAALVREGFGIAIIDGLTGMSARNTDLKVLPLEGSPKILVQMQCREDFRDEQDVGLMLKCLRESARKMGLERFGKS